MPDECLLEDAKNTAKLLLEATKELTTDGPLFICLGETHYCTYDMAFTLALIQALKTSGKIVRLGLEHEHNPTSFYFLHNYKRATNLPKKARIFENISPEASVHSLVAYSECESEKILAYWALRNGVGIDFLDLMVRPSKSTECDEAFDLSDEFTRVTLKKYGRLEFQNCMSPAGDLSIRLRNEGMKNKALSYANQFKPDIYIILTGRGHLSSYENRDNCHSIDSKLREAGQKTQSVIVIDNADEALPEDVISVIRGAGPSSEEYFRCIDENRPEDFIMSERSAMLGYFINTSIDMSTLLSNIKYDQNIWEASLNQMFRDRLASYGF